MGSQDTDASPGYLRARVLRYWVCLQLRTDVGRYGSPNLSHDSTASGLRIKGRPSKAISDTLRWATSRGWAIRAGRGVYRPGRIRETTLAYMHEVVARSIRDGDLVTANTLANYRRDNVVLSGQE